MIHPATRHKIFSRLQQALEDGYLEKELDRLLKKYGKATMKIVLREGINYPRERN